MKTKINISAEMREFNCAVEMCDMLTDYKYDRLPALALISACKKEHLPHHADWLGTAMTKIAVKR